MLVAFVEDKPAGGWFLVVFLALIFPLNTPI